MVSIVMVDAISGIINDSVGSVVVSDLSSEFNNYFLEVNQTPSFMMFLRLLEKGVATPIRKLKVVFDYYTHSSTAMIILVVSLI